MPSCRTCGQSIDFYPTASGGKMPVDLGTNPKGDVVVENGIVRKIRRGEEPAVLPRMSHFATCPQASNWSGKNRGSAGGTRPAGQARGGPSTPSPIALAVAAVRDCAWQIKHSPNPVETAHALLTAAAQVLHESGRTVEELRDIVARAVRP